MEGACGSNSRPSGTAGALQDATRIAINHFHATKTKDGDEFEMYCSRVTARWPGTLYNKLGG